MIAKLSSLAMAALTAILLASCTSTVSELHASQLSGTDATTSSHSARAPVTGGTLRRLPRGVFYFLAGSNPGSCNIWEALRSGVVRELTHNGRLGISAMSAARQGIVAADAAHGADELAQITADGARYLPVGKWEGHGEAPAISGGGGLAYMAPPYRNSNFELLYRRSFDAGARVFFRSHLPLSGPGLGPGNQVAVVAQRYATASSKAKSWLFVVNRANGGVHQKTTALTQFDYAIWNTRAPGIVISTWGGNAEYISQHRHLLLPHGWAPLTWSPSGNELLVIRPNSGAAGEQIGLWDERKPRTVTSIGRTASGIVITQGVWLTRPASLK